MTQLKKHLVYTLLLCFVATTGTGIYILVSGLDVPAATTVSVFSAAIAQAAAIIITVVKSKEYFEDPETVERLKEEHAAKVAELQSQLTKSIQDREATMLWIGSKIMPDDPRHPLYEWMSARDDKTPKDKQGNHYLNQ